MYEKVRAEFAKIIRLETAERGMNNKEMADHLKMAPPQACKLRSKTATVCPTLRTVCEVLDALGYDVTFECREDQSKPGRPADPNKPVKYTRNNPPPGKSFERVGSTWLPMWDETKMHEWDEAEERAIKTGTRKPPWPEGHPKYDPNR